MSYCRWGAGSAVYVYPADRGIVCCGCSMGEGDDFVAQHDGMLTHLKEHMEQGDLIPDYAIDRLTAEIAKRRKA